MGEKLNDVIIWAGGEGRDLGGGRVIGAWSTCLRDGTVHNLSSGAFWFLCSSETHASVSHQASREAASRCAFNDCACTTAYIQCNGLSINSILSSLWVYIWLLSYKMAVWAKTLFVCFCILSLIYYANDCFLLFRMKLLSSASPCCFFSGNVEILVGFTTIGPWQWLLRSESCVSSASRTQVNTRYTRNPEPFILRLIPTARHLKCPKIEMCFANVLFYLGCSNVQRYIFLICSTDRKLLQTILRLVKQVQNHTVVPPATWDSWCQNSRMSNGRRCHLGIAYWVSTLH